VISSPFSFVRNDTPNTPGPAPCGESWAEAGGEEGEGARGWREGRVKARNLRYSEFSSGYLIKRIKSIRINTFKLLGTDARTADEAAAAAADTAAAPLPAAYR
jgi:hypothetical protein